MLSWLLGNVWQLTEVGDYEVQKKNINMIITATFTGTNSLGYENGKEYQLKAANLQGISIKRLDGTGKCLYQSLSSFLKNWNNIRVVS